MKAVVLEEFGDASKLKLAEIPQPVPGPGQVLIRVVAAGINPADWKDREGHTSVFFDIQFPYVIGFDAAGIVEAVGHGIDEFAPGDRVLTTGNHGRGEQGSYAQFIIADRERVGRLAVNFPMTLAAAIPIAGLTAWHALFDEDKGRLVAGQRVLVNGGSGGVGSFAVPLARWTGAEVACTCSARNREYARERGADPAIDYAQDDTRQRVLAWSPGGVDLVIDTVGGGTLDDPLDLLAPGGTLVSIATLVADDHIAALQRAAEAAGKRCVLAILDDSNCASTLERLATLVHTRQVPPPAIECFPMNRVQEAHRKIATGHVRGKLILEITD